MNYKSAFHVISLGLVLLMALALNPAAASAEKVLNVSGDPNELGVTTFNPIKVELSHDAMWVIYDRFVEMGLDNKFYPGLAESWVISSDGLVWKMKLKNYKPQIIPVREKWLRFLLNYLVGTGAHSFYHGFGELVITHGLRC